METNEQKNVYSMFFTPQGGNEVYNIWERSQWAKIRYSLESALIINGRSMDTYFLK